MSIFLRHDTEITISIADSRYSTDWKQTPQKQSAIYDRLQYPIRGPEKLKEYLAMSKREQDRRKDVGGFVGGRLNGPRRKAENVVDRRILSLDFDNLPPEGPEILLRKLDVRNCGYCLHSTRKHRPEAPRVRVLIVTDRSMTVDEYGAVIRKVTEWLGMAWADPTTFDINRLMYWPSCCTDSQYLFRYEDKPPLSVDAVLQSYTVLGMDWHDVSCWPKHPDEKKTV